MENERMFDKDSFSDLKNASEVKAAVLYFAHNELKFRDDLASEGLSYDNIQNTVKELWLNLLQVCDKYKYSDYIIERKKQIYK